LYLPIIKQKEEKVGKWFNLLPAYKEGPNIKAVHEMKIFTILSKFVYSPECVQWRVTYFATTDSLLVMLFGPQNT
jgi:hypothetical protein